MVDPIKASDRFVQCLEMEGIEYVFGVPGEENADLMMSLDRSEKIRFILTRHEQGAAFMAEVYGRLTGDPAVCLGTLGPGATNLITGVADANMDRSPMLVITGQGALTRLHKESHQVMDVVKMFESVTKWATSVRHPDNIPEIIRKAVRLARTEKPGACHIELPEDIAEENSTTPPLVVKRFRRPVPAPDVIDAAVQRIRAAKRPILIAGNGMIRKQASRELRRLCEQTGIGVVSTFMAKGCVDMDAPYCLFTIGLGAKDLVACAVDAADLIITVGYDMVEYPPRLWNPDGNKEIIDIDFIPAEIDSHYQPGLELIGDLPLTLKALNEGMAAGPKPTYDLHQQASVRREMLEDFREHCDDRTEPLIRPQKVLWDVRQAIDSEGIVLSDVGAHKMWIARYFHTHEPNTVLIPNGFCSMGFALPGAIAASLVYPTRQILAICGDAGFLMNVQEMETARRLNSHLVAMIWEDFGYGLIAWKQDNQFGRHTDLSFGNPDWIALANAFGWKGHRVERSVDLPEILHRALEEEGPSLIVVSIDYRENATLTERMGRIVCPI